MENMIEKEQLLRLNKKEIARNLSEFSRIVFELVRLYDEVDKDSQNILCEKYPFELSLDEMAFEISAWEENFLEKIK